MFLCRDSLPTILIVQSRVGNKDFFSLVALSSQHQKKQPASPFEALDALI